MIFDRLKKAVKKEKALPSAEVHPPVITAEGWKRMHTKKKPAKVVKTAKKARS